MSIERFLAILTRTAGRERLFATFAFLLDETGGALGALDPEERAQEFREIEDDALSALADRLDHLDGYSDDLDVRWDEWGAVRAATHRAVWEALRV